MHYSLYLTRTINHVIVRQYNSKCTQRKRIQRIYINVVNPWTRLEPSDINVREHSPKRFSKCDVAAPIKKDTQASNT